LLSQRPSPSLKTSLRYQLEKMPAAEIARRQADLCASYQAAVFDALVRKAKLALERGFAGPRTKDQGPSIPDPGSPCSVLRLQSSEYRSFGLSGGVANNRTLQALLEKVARGQNVPFLRAQPKHTGDNAGMIAFATFAEREPGGLNPAHLALEIAPSLPLAM
jgi:N6-L-threonylcarbamoyladenine synthase